MTPVEHNKYVGLSNLAYGIFHVLMIFVMIPFVLGMMSMMARTQGGPAPPMAFMGIVMVVAAVINVIMSIPAFIAGYAFLKRKSWAKVAGIVAAILAAMSVPIGTAVCVYTLWFVFGEAGKSLYDKASAALPPPPPSEWVGAGRQGEIESNYHPPLSPPDWRS